MSGSSTPPRFFAERIAAAVSRRTKTSLAPQTQIGISPRTGSRFWYGSRQRGPRVRGAHPRASHRAAICLSPPSVRTRAPPTAPAAPGACGTARAATRCTPLHSFFFFSESGHYAEKSSRRLRRSRRSRECVSSSAFSSSSRDDSSVGAMKSRIVTERHLAGRFELPCLHRRRRGRRTPRAPADRRRRGCVPSRHGPAAPTRGARRRNLPEPRWKPGARTSRGMTRVMWCPWRRADRAAPGPDASISGEAQAKPLGSSDFGFGWASSEGVGTRPRRRPRDALLFREEDRVPEPYGHVRGVRLERHHGERLERDASQSVVRSDSRRRRGGAPNAVAVFVGREDPQSGDPRPEREHVRALPALVRPVPVVQLARVRVGRSLGVRGDGGPVATRQRVRGRQSASAAAPPSGLCARSAVATFGARDFASAVSAATNASSVGGRRSTPTTARAAAKLTWSCRHVCDVSGAPNRIRSGASPIARDANAADRRYRKHPAARPHRAAFTAPPAAGSAPSSSEPNRSHGQARAAHGAGTRGDDWRHRRDAPKRRPETTSTEARWQKSSESAFSVVRTLDEHFKAPSTRTERYRAYVQFL